MFNLTWKRIKFILGHALVGGLIAHLLMWLGAPFIAGTVGGLAVLVVGEGKELIGRLKERGGFKNTVWQNIKAMRQSQDEPWELLQTFGAIAVYVGAMGILQFLGIHTF